jgi:flagellar biosynthetic protein FlhB
LMQALVLLPLFAWILYALVNAHWNDFLILPRMNVESSMTRVATILSALLWKSAVVLLVLGCIDLFRQRRRWMSQLRMTKQEVREEQKEVEGNPLIRMRIRRLQREALRRRMMEQVPKATAVIVNPTHFAVAIRYQPSSMAAPKVVAKGKNHLALRIRDLAIRSQVPVIENPPLAQSLFRSAEVGQEIPAHLYQAVAEVLAYIYRLTRGHLPGQ